jgi:two-component system nitrogen regulation sensor histidine kinase NtrY
MEIVFETIGAGVVSVDAGGRISTINPAAQMQLGAPAGAGLIGQPLDGIASCQELLEVIADLSARLRPGRDSTRRQVEIRRGDDVATLLVSVAVLQDESGESVGRVIVFDDHTQLVKVQRVAAWREVARRIAHEIKNPLTPIQLSAQRIRRRFGDRFDEDDGRVFDECVDTIMSQVEGLELLVDEFSKFARLPAANPRPDDLNRLIRDAVASYAGTEGVVFETDLDPRLPALDLDREQIRRALTNLIDNAIAAGGAGCIRVGTDFDAGLQTVRIEVADDGAGIPVEHRRRIFEPYFSTRHQGTGLGLAIVSRIVADHHGYIRVQDRSPRGTCFVIEIPIHAGDAIRASRSATRPTPLPRPPSTQDSV